MRIINCTIDGFDFGIFAIESKVAPDVRKDGAALRRGQNLIQGNTINARFTAISLLSVDNTFISNNNIVYTAEAGTGIHVARDSDLNLIRGNRIFGAATATTAQAVTAPGPAIPSPDPADPSSNPIVSKGQAVLITQKLGPEPTLLNAIIDEDELFQLDVVPSPCPNENFSEDNYFANNTISFTNTRKSDGVVISIGQRTTVRGNKITGADLAIRAGIQSAANGLDTKFPGGCSAPTGRLCLRDSDCNILGTTGATCSSPTPPMVKVFWVSDANLIERNTINGPFNRGIATTGRNTIIRGNRILGTPQGTEIGISLSTKFALETTTVTGNVVLNVDVAILLTNRPSTNPDMPADVFGARVSRNDFMFYNTAVRSDIAAKLSADGRGNFWGLNCPQGFDPAKAVRTGGLAPAAVLTDDHPYGVLVSATLVGSLPQPCR